MKITVVGTGHVGRGSGTCLAGVDNDIFRRDRGQAGTCAHEEGGR